MSHLADFAPATTAPACISILATGYTRDVKHLVDLDEDALAAAQEHLGTTTIKDTVNAALNLATGRTISGEEIEAALDVLAGVTLSDEDRAALWR